MLRSLMSGVSGVKGHQTLLDVVGDNISNANTTGFKKSSVQFQELMSQTEEAATAPSNEKGGTNPKQIGLGMTVGSVVVDQTQGNINYTGSKSDMAIEGDGFFVVEDGTSKVYSRAGSFILDGNGDLIQSSTGFRLQGFEMYDDPLNPGTKIVGTDLQDINIPVGQKLPSKATTTAGFRCNLDSRSENVLQMGLSSQDLVLGGTIGNTEYPNITFSEGNTVAEFLTMTFTQSDGTSQEVHLELNNINSETGLPILANGTLDLDGVAGDEIITFDDTTGQIKVLDSSGASTLWTGDIGVGLDYSVINDIGGTSTPYLAEFNDAPDGGRILNLWGDDGSGNMEHYSIDLDSNDDGSFNIPSGTQITVAGNAVDVQATPSGMGVALSQNGTVIKSFDLQTSSIHTTKYDIFDSQGNAHTLETSWEKVDNNTWRWRTWLPDMSGIGMENNTGLLEFSPEGLVERVTDSTGAEASTIGVNFASLGAEDSEIQLDFTGNILGTDDIEAVTQFGSAFTTKEYYQDGYEMGVLKDYSVGGDGVIRGVYDNGQTENLYTVSLAVFSNSSGLEKMGNGAYRDTANSGIPQILKPMEGGSGSIAGSSLEASNVDLTSEFVDLIKAQRGFQASARVITTSDEVLEELMNLKR